MFKHLPLRLLLTLPYAGLVLLLAAPVAWLSYHAADDAIDDMAYRLAIASTERIREKTLAYMENWRYALTAAATHVQIGAGGRIDLAEAEHAVWSAGVVSAVRPSYVYFGAADGRFVGVQHNASGPALLKLRTRGDARRRELYEVAATGDRAHPLGLEGADYDARQRPWYLQAQKTDGPVWSPVYLDFSTQAPMTTLAQTRRGPGGELAGVFAADVPLAQLQAFLQGLELAQRGLAFIVSRDGRLIASSAPTVRGATGTAAPQRELPLATESTVPELAASYRAIAARAVVPAASAPTAEVVAMPGGRTLLVSATALAAREPGIDWQVVVAVHEDVLTAGIRRNAWRTAGLTALAVAATLAVGMLILRGLARDIGRLTQTAEQLSLEEAPAPLDLQRRDELGRLAGAFDRMGTRLRTSAQTVRDQNSLLLTTVERLREEALARSEAENRLRRMAESLSEGLILLDRQWRVTFVNAVGERLARRPAAQMLGQDLRELFPDRKGSPWGRALQQVFSSGEPLVVEAPSLEMPGCWREARVFPTDEGVAVFFSDVTERHEAREALAQRERELTQLTGQLLRAQSEERRAVARELHDELGQQLAALRINLQALLARCPDAELHGRLEDSLAIVKQLIEQVRERALDLYPVILDDLGLHAALQWLCERQAQRSGLRIGLHAGDHLPALPRLTELMLYRIVQEAVSNAIKHAQATRIDVSLSASSRSLMLSVRDDGVGFDAEHVIDASRGHSLGLTSMRERAQQLGGQLRIHSEAKRGTTLIVTLPSVPTTADESDARPQDQCAAG